MGPFFSLQGYRALIIKVILQEVEYLPALWGRRLSGGLVAEGNRFQDMERAGAHEVVLFS